uniref:cyclin-dependent kinase C-2-like n=1 Tax=Erigeron canadensis TaxID=72917 RepID=UPI001CB93218|nr:cyclin-dependent kinase C-2-like [Erigeron canadensis]
MLVFSQVYMAKEIRTGEIAVLKKIWMDNERVLRKKIKEGKASVHIQWYHGNKYKGGIVFHPGMKIKFPFALFLDGQMVYLPTLLKGQGFTPSLLSSKSSTKSST